MNLNITELNLIINALYYISEMTRESNTKQVYIQLAEKLETIKNSL